MFVPSLKLPILMKTMATSLFILLFLSFLYLPSSAQSDPDPQVLVGEWQLDMSPEDPDDANFASMLIRKVGKSTFSGYFYRPGVPIREARIRISQGRVYGALLSGDNSGDYHSAFFFEDGRLHGTTHALERDFLAVWTAVKTDP